MCLIVFAWRPSQAVPLVVAANRDEFHARAALPMSAWEDAPQLIAGRDLQAGGTWMGITREGRFAALTNIREPNQPPGRHSRGTLPERFLRAEMPPEEYLAELTSQRADFAGFNLLVGDSQSLWHLNSREGAPRRLPEGVFGLSNASLDTPWPKLLRARSKLAGCLEAPRPDTLLQVVADRQQAGDHELPDTGVGAEMEKLLSSAFIVGRDYGTRASTALIRRHDGSLDMLERSFGPEGLLGEARFRHPAAAAGHRDQRATRMGFSALG